MANCHSDLDCVEFSAFFSKSLGLSQVHEELTTSNEAHHKENLLVSHEHVVHTHEEGVIGLH